MKQRFNIFKQEKLLCLVVKNKIDDENAQIKKND